MVSSLKDDCNFKKPNFPKVSWVKLIWSPDYPPSKSLMVWRLMFGKLPIDDNLASRGCHLPSVCSLCHSNSETSFHLFFECCYVMHTWSWFASIINKTFNFQSMQDVWDICNNSWNPQCKTILTTTIINIFNGVWFARNQLRFQNKKIPWKTSIATILSQMALSGNLSKNKAYANISNFMLLRKFNVTLHPPKSPQVNEVIW